MAVPLATFGGVSTLPSTMTSWNAAEYARNSASQLQWANELLSRLHLKGSEAVVDLGCGDGKITVALAQALPAGRAVGIDSSQEMIQYAQAHHSEHLNLTFRLLDFRTLDYSEEFDLAFSNAALHWVQDHRSLLARVYHVLRRGGRLAFSFGGKGNAEDVLKVAFAVGQRPEWLTYFEGFENPYFFYTPEEYRPWLAEAGFTITRLELVPKDMIHHGRVRFYSWIRTTWMPITGKVPEPRREDFIRDFVAAYLESFPPDHEGKIHVRMARLEVEAAKPSGG